jgi:hypothetical protein
MDISIDTLYFPDISVFDDLMRPNGKHKGLSKVDLGPVQQLALEIPVINDYHGSLSLDPDTAQWQFAAIKCFPQLRKVTFVPRFLEFARKYAEELYRMFRNGYLRYGDVFDIQDQYDPEVLGKLKFSVVDCEDFCHGKS